MSMNRSALPWVLVGILGTAWLASRMIPGGDPATDARLAQERADSLGAVSDSLRASNALLAQRSDSVGLALADSVARWESERAVARARVAEATRRASVVASDLAARLDSTEAALFAQYDQARDSIDAANAEVIASLEVERDALVAQRALLFTRIDGLEAELNTERAMTAQLTLAVESLNSALSARQRRAWGERALAVGALAVVLLR